MQNLRTLAVKIKKVIAVEVSLVQILDFYHEGIGRLELFWSLRSFRLINAYFANFLSCFEKCNLKNSYVKSIHQVFKSNHSWRKLKNRSESKKSQQNCAAITFSVTYSYTAQILQRVALINALSEGKKKRIILKLSPFLEISTHPLAFF